MEHTLYLIALLAAPLLLSALGGGLCGRAGLPAWGLGGVALLGGMAAMIILQQTESLVLSLATAILAGLCWNAIFAAGVVLLGQDALLLGIGMHCLMLAGQSIFLPNAREALSVPVSPALVLALAAILLLLVTGLCYGTRWGLRVRAAGLAPRALRTAGLSVRRLWFTCQLVAGALGGLAGALFVLLHGQPPMYLGLLALGVTYAGFYTPQGALLVACVYALGEAIRRGAVAPFLPTLLADIAPYLFLLLALLGAGAIRRGRKFVCVA